MSKFVISDIHGCLKTFEAMLDKIAFSKKDTLFLLGDYIDRGPDSKGVLDLIFKLQDEGYDLRCLLGNHEEKLIQTLTEEETYRNWLYYGGEQALESFGVAHPSEIPEKYFDFIKKLPRFFEVENYILCHAGMNFKIENPFEDTNALIWIRHWYEQINYEWLGNRIIVHGHQPTVDSDMKTMLKNLHENQYLDIDCGCFKPESCTGNGILACFELEKQELYFQKCIDRVTYVWV
jgi:serine/threonine protein phosphatase 1